MALGGVSAVGMALGMAFSGASFNAALGGVTSPRGRD